MKCIQGFETIQSEYPVYLSDESKLSPKPFDYLFFPKNEAELAAVLQEMSRQNIKVTIAAARTGLVGMFPRKGRWFPWNTWTRWKLSFMTAPAANGVSRLKPV